jgi:acetyl-CoA acyltransferase
VREAVIVSGVRTAIGKAPRGTLATVRPEDLGALVIKEAIRRAEGLDPAQVEDVIMGCAVPEGEQGLNMARICSALAGLPNSASAVTVNRYCSSGLQAIAIAAQQIMTGMADVCVAGGAESMSRVYSNWKVAPNPTLMSQAPAHYMAMGHTAEQVAQRFNITREAQDRFGLRSHERAASAIKAGKFAAETVPVRFPRWGLLAGKAVARDVCFDTDEGVRFDASLDAMSKLKPAFGTTGTVTAGTSSQMSDGAAAVVVMGDDTAARMGLKPLAIFRGFVSAGCDPEVMGIGPALAVPKLLEKTGVTLNDIDLVELNEAFASQAVYVIEKLGLDPERVNVNGGAIALGHPLGATGTRQTVTIMSEAARRNARYGIVTMCIGGGQGAAGLFEFVND